MKGWLQAYWRVLRVVLGVAGLTGAAAAVSVLVLAPTIVAFEVLGNMGWAAGVLQAVWVVLVVPAIGATIAQMDPRG